MSDTSFDAIVVGASLAGCTAATLLARQGLRIALVERHRSPEAYKQLCTHFIQAPGTDVLRQLGVIEEMEAAGAVRNGIELWTPGGWIGHHPPMDDAGEPLHGYSLRRTVLDPLLRRLATSTPGVTPLLGHSVQSVRMADGVVTGVYAKCVETGEKKELSAPLVVAADGRNSTVATLAGVKLQSSPNTRWGIAVYAQGVNLRRGRLSQMWLNGSKVRYVFPNENGITMIVIMDERSQFDETAHADPWGTVVNALRACHDAPDLESATPVGRSMFVKDYPGLWRPPVSHGMALIGDAAQSLDYLWGTGCGWALQSGQWLAEIAGPALRGQEKLSSALNTYARRYRQSMAPHRWVINDYSQQVKMGPIARIMFTAAGRDEALAREATLFANRQITPARFLRPAMLLRAAWVNVTRAPSPEGTRASIALLSLTRGPDAA
jgi:menaquinone-9 beta-reductase